MAVSFAQVSAMSVVTGSGKLAPVSAIPVVVISDGSVPVSPDAAQLVVDVTANATFPRANVQPIPIVYATGTPPIAPTDPIPVFVVGGGFPNAGNTGPAAGTVFTTTTGDFVTSANNQVIANRQVNNGQIDIRHSGVIVRDCIVNSQDFTAIRTTVAASIPGCLIERCRLTGIGGQNAISPDFAAGVEIRFCDISGYENGISIGADGMNIHDNYIHGLISLNATPHIDGIQGSGGFTSLIIRNNTIVSWDTSCIIMQTEGAGFSGLVIDGNRLLFDAAHAGSELAYGILCQSINANVAQNITITNNRIQKSQAAQNYIFIHNLTNPVTISGNVDDTTGAPVTADVG